MYKLHTCLYYYTYTKSPAQHRDTYIFASIVWSLVEKRCLLGTRPRVDAISEIFVGVTAWWVASLTIVQGYSMQRFSPGLNSATNRVRARSSAIPVCELHWNSSLWSTRNLLFAPNVPSRRFVTFQRIAPRILQLAGEALTGSMFHRSLIKQNLQNGPRICYNRVKVADLL